MLVLSRKCGEKIVIEVGGQEIEIMVTKLAGERVRLGFVAPLHAKIHRKEVLDAIKRTKEFTP